MLSWVSSLVHSITEYLSAASLSPSASSSCRSGSIHLAEMRLKSFSMLAPLCMGKPEMDGLISALKIATTPKKDETVAKDAETNVGISGVTIQSGGGELTCLGPIGGALLCSFLVDALGSLPPASLQPPCARPWIADLAAACEEAASSLLRHHVSIITNMQSSSQSPEASISPETVSAVAMTSSSSPDAVWSPSWQHALAMLANSISALATGEHRTATPLASLVSATTVTCSSSLIAPLLGLSDGISDASQPPGGNISLLGKILIMGSLGVICSLVLAESRIVMTGRDLFVQDSSLASNGPLADNDDLRKRKALSHPIRSAWAKDVLLQISDWGTDASIHSTEDQSYNRHWSYNLPMIPGVELVAGFLGSRATIRRLLAEVAGLQGSEPLPLHDCLHALERWVGEDVKKWVGFYISVKS